MIFNVFQRDAKKRSLYTQRGYKPYARRKGFLGLGGELVDHVSDKAARFETNLGLLSRAQQAEAMEMIDSERARFTESGLRDMRSEFAIANMQRVGQMRTEAAEEIANMPAGRRPTSTAEAQRNYNRRIEGFRRAKAKLRQASRQAGEVGTAVQYQGTGFEMLDPSVDRFYDMFDDAVAARKEEYAQMYSGKSYDEIKHTGYRHMNMHTPGGGGGFFGGRNMFASFFSGSGGEFNQEFFDEVMAENVGTRDIDALVLGDIINQGLYDLAFLDTAGYEEIGTDQTMEMLRENFATVYSTATESINTIAKEEDEARTRMAQTMEIEARKTQAKGKAQTERSIGQQISDISKAERSAKKQRDAQISALTDTPTGKRRVKGVDFTEDRPA